LLRNGFAASQLIVLPISPPVPKTWYELDKFVRHAGDEPLVLYAGKLVAPKGVFLLLEALKKIEHVPWRALLVGDGPDEQALDTAILDAGLSSRIEIVKAVHRDALGDFLNRARFVAFPSMWPESLGLIGPEAMFFGKPVVAFDVGAVREWLTDGENGFLVPAGDIDGLANRMKLLLESESLSQSMNNSARRTADRILSTSQWTADLTGLYRKCIERWLRGCLD
jgi:glycosyltransferase involved in cell wall biosynthesis